VSFSTFSDALEIFSLEIRQFPKEEPERGNGKYTKDEETGGQPGRSEARGKMLEKSADSKKLPSSQL